MKVKPETHKPNAKQKILDAALNVIRAKGYFATSIDDLCAAAGVTKGAFFHHFSSKEDLAVKAAEHWSNVTHHLFENAAYQKMSDPLEQLLGYIDFRKELLQGDVPEFTCLVGTMVQEAYDTHPAIREACHKSIFGHASTLVGFATEAKKLYAPNATWTPESIALHTQAVIQGAFILAKATGNADIAAESITHLRRYIEFLFNYQRSKTWLQSEK